jgi:membrane fusion protein, multidrug efflux system
VLAGDLAMSATDLRSPEAATASAPRHPWARRLGRILSGILVLASVLLGYFVYRLYYANPRTDDAYVHANTAALAAHVSGQIVQLPIRDNQQVKKGDLLFVVDPRPYKLALDTAKTKLNLTEIEVKTLEDTINSAAAQLTDRKIQAANAKQYLDRIVPLHERDFVTENDVVEARNKLRAARPALPARVPSLRKHRMRWVFRAT